MKSLEINVSQDPNDYLDWCPVCGNLANYVDLHYLKEGTITHKEVSHYNKPLNSEREKVGSGSGSTE